MSRGIQCSSMSPMSACWTLLKSANIWDSFNLDRILQKGDSLNLSIITDILGGRLTTGVFLLKIHQ